MTKLADGRELCSRTELKRRLLKKLAVQNGTCGICGEPILDIQDAMLDYIQPPTGGHMEWSTRDDSWGNIQAAHSLCNMAKGLSKELRAHEQGQG